MPIREVVRKPLKKRPLSMHLHERTKKK